MSADLFSKKHLLNEPFQHADSVCVVAASLTHADALKNRIQLRNEPIEAVSFDQAPNYVKTNHPTLLVLDVGSGDYLQAFQALLKETPAIILCDQYNDDFFLACHDQAEQVRDFLIKPVADAHLLSRVLRALEDRQRLRQLNRQQGILKELLVLSKRSGMFNTAYILSMLQEEVAQLFLNPEKSLSLLVIELSGYPQPLPNELETMIYSRVASLIEETARGLDVVGEYLENKFLVIMPETPIKGANSLSKRLAAKLNLQQFHHKNQLLQLKTRYGAAEFAGCQHYEDLLNQAMDNLASI